MLTKRNEMSYKGGAAGAAIPKTLDGGLGGVGNPIDNLKVREMAVSSKSVSRESRTLFAN